jgi:hypothetical protein
MRKIISIITLIVLLTACKAKQGIVSEQSAEESKASKEIINGHLKNMPAFKTLSIRASARYEDSKQSQNVNADIRIKKDEIILVSVKVLGITMAKALITPTRVSYYEKLNGRYFDGNYELLSRWLGTELDFNKVQNMLLGRAMDNLEKGSYKATLEGGLHKLSSGSKGGTTKDFFFESAQYLLKRQAISQGGNEPRSVDISYPTHTTHRNGALPGEIKILAQQKDKVNIELEYNNVTFDEDLSFPYEIPQGYDKITIDAP